MEGDPSPLEESLVRLVVKFGGEAAAKSITEYIDPSKDVSDPVERTRVRRRISLIRSRRNRDIRAFLSDQRSRSEAFNEMATLADSLPQGKQKFDTNASIMYDLAKRDPRFAAIFSSYQDLEHYARNGNYLNEVDA